MPLSPFFTADATLPSMKLFFLFVGAHPSFMYADFFFWKCVPKVHRVSWNAKPESFFFFGPSTFLNLK